jgi:hypothetical protein
MRSIMFHACLRFTGSMPVVGCKQGQHPGEANDSGVSPVRCYIHDPLTNFMALQGERWLTSSRHTTSGFPIVAIPSDTRRFMPPATHRKQSSLPKCVPGPGPTRVAASREQIEREGVCANTAPLCVHVCALRT